MSLLFTANPSSPGVQTASYTIQPTDDYVPFLVTAARIATLPEGKNQFAAYATRKANLAGGGGIVLIENSASSTAVVSIAAASGNSIFGGATLAPGQYAICQSSGFGVWYTTVGSGTNNLVTAAVPLTSAQILALNTTPVSLIATPGSGKAIRVVDLALKFTPSGTAYANGGALEFRYTDGSGTKVTADIAAAVVTASGTTASFTNVAGIEASLTLTANAAVVVRAASADFITGTGTGVFFITYRVIG